VRLWIEDLQFDLAGAMRASGVGLAAVAWASVLGSEAQQSETVRAYAQVAAAIVGVCVSQWFTRLPPSATTVDVLRPFERDILAAAREQARGDDERVYFLAARMAMLATVRLRRGGSLPRDRRAWFRSLARLAGEG
jgi:hypothetical protein